MSKDQPGDTPQPDEATLRLWGKQPRHRRGPQPKLSVAAIVHAAFELADAEGLGAVSMARVATQLECTTMALYRHIASKDELITLLVDRVAADTPPLPDGLTWRGGLGAWVRVQIDGVLAHPWLLETPLASTPLGPHRSRWIDQGLGVMRDLPLRTTEKAQILGLLSQHVLAEARVLVEGRDMATNPFMQLAADIHRLAAAEDLPHLYAALADSATDDSLDTLGIELILDGVEARLQRQHRRGQGA